MLEQKKKTHSNLQLNKYINSQIGPSCHGFSTTCAKTPAALLIYFFWPLKKKKTHKLVLIRFVMKYIKYKLNLCYYTICIIVTK